MAPRNYSAVPPSRSDVHQAEIGGCDSDAVHSPTKWMSSVTRWTYFFLGCAILLPFNAMTNGTPFFLSRLTGSPFYFTFGSYLTSVYTLTKLFFLFYCTVTSKQSSPSRRVFASNIVTAVLITSLCLSTFVRGSPLAFFSYSLFSAASMAITSSYLCAAVYSQAALLGPLFLQSVLLGQGAIAAAISTVQFVSAALSVWGLSSKPPGATEPASPDDRNYQAEGMAARIFFGVAALFLIVTLVAYAWLIRQPFYKSITSSVKQPSESEDSDELTGLVSDSRRKIATPGMLHAYQISRRNWVYMFSIAYTYAVTLSVYPAITVRVQSVNPSVSPVLFAALHFLVFTTTDFIGRRTCSFPRFLSFSAESILVMSLMRTLFIPLILFCNVHRPTMIPVTPVINSDILYMLVLLAMGYTNGLISCLATVLAVSPERNRQLEGRHEDIDVLGALSGTFVAVGLASGALSSFGVSAML